MQRNRAKKLFLDRLLGENVCFAPGRKFAEK